MSKKNQQPTISKKPVVPRPGAGRSVPAPASQSGSGATRSGASGSTKPTLTVPLQSGPQRLDRRPVQLAWALLVGAVAIALYVNTFGNELALDDIAAITQNLFVQKGIHGIPGLLKTEFWHFSNISLGYYRPLSLISFAFEKEFFNADPHISHMINAVLYGITGLVLTLLLQKWLPGRFVLTTLMALLFMAHPVHTEVVANIKSRDEILSFLFIISMLLSYWQYLETRKLGYTALACLFLYLAYLSKESSIVAVALLPLMQYYLAGRTIGQSLVSLVPFLIVTLLFFIQKKAMIGTLSGNPPVDLANYPYAIEKTKLATTFKFVAYYLRLLIYPHPLVYDYSYNVIPSGGAGDALTWIGFLATCGLIWLAWKGLVGRTFWGFGLAWFFITMVPAIGFIAGRGGILAERFLYAPVLGYVMVVLWALDAFLSRRKAYSETTPFLPRYGALLGLCVLTLGLYSFKTVERNKDWKDNFTLFTSGEKYAGESCQVNRHVANEWINKCAVEKDPKLKRVYFNNAISHLKRSTEIYPGFGEAFFSIAYSYQRLIPNRDSAVYFYKQAIRASSNYAPAYNNLGVIFQGEGKLPLASYFYNMSMMVNPAYADGINNWANLKKATGLDVKVLPEEYRAEAMLPAAPTPATVPAVQLPLSR